jgi:hypothetical protein
MKFREQLRKNNAMERLIGIEPTPGEVRFIDPRRWNGGTYPKFDNP